jgi:predicted pyridoxine 5'-phosphate oxidase superfamily flavin-nucleotide-binding protein
MAKLTQEMKEFIDRVRFCNAATANLSLIPNVSPKGSIMWLDDETIAFGDYGSVHTRENLKESPKIAVSVVDTQPTRCFQFKGTAELLTSGEVYRKVADRAKAKAKERTGRQLPDPTNAVIVHVEEIFAFPLTE